MFVVSFDEPGEGISPSGRMAKNGPRLPVELVSPEMTIPLMELVDPKDAYLGVYSDLFDDCCAACDRILENFGARIFPQGTPG